MRLSVRCGPSRAVTRTDSAVPCRLRIGWDHGGDLDGEIQYIFFDHAERHGPERMLFPDGSYLELVAEERRTAVRAVLPGSLDGTDWAEVYDGMEEGWRTFLEQLRFLLECRPQGRRRTIYLTGTATAAEALAIADAAGGAGRPWHESRYQRMTVSPSGHLLVVAGQAPLASTEPAPSSLTVVTYGLDDEAFAGLLAEWTARWDGVAGARVTTVAGESTLPASAGADLHAGQVPA